MSYNINKLLYTRCMGPRVRGGGGGGLKVQTALVAPTPLGGCHNIIGMLRFTAYGFN